jgi:glucose-6-phosphate isomerase
MGGSSLAPEVISLTMRESASRELVILDSTAPHFVSSVLREDPTTTFFVVSSKSGTTIETTSHLALIEERLVEAGLDSRDHVIVVTDPGSALAELAAERNWEWIEGDPDVGGRFSALSAFGLTPAALIGVDPSILLDDASEMLASIHEVSVRLASYLAPHRYLYFVDSQGRFPGLADWIEQLIAESTGKDGKGLLPIAILPSEEALTMPVVDLAEIIDAPLGAQFILWEWVTALLGFIHGVDPFDQPDVQATKSRTSEVLASVESDQPSATVAISDLRSSLRQLLKSREYLSICAFLDPARDHELIRLRHLMEREFKKPVSFGWGPRFLHSTGQFHKGGPKSGVFLSITLRSGEEVAIPGKAFGLKQLIRAQAEGDKRALLEAGNEVVSLDLDDVSQIKRLIEEFSA